jgi:hypothetical protein
VAELHGWLLRGNVDLLRLERLTARTMREPRNCFGK